LNTESERDAAKGAATDSEGDDPEFDAKMAEGKAKAASIRRDAGLQDHLHKIVVCGVYVIGALIIVAVGIWLYHFIVPTEWRFLTLEQIESLQNILFSGAIGGAISGQAKKISK